MRGGGGGVMGPPEMEGSLGSKNKWNKNCTVKLF